MNKSEIDVSENETEIFDFVNNSFFNFSNETNGSLDVTAFTKESRIEAIVYGILFIVAAGGNLPVLWSLIKNHRRKCRIQTMIFHLAIADSIVTFIMIPLEIAWRITVEWIAGDIACRIMLFWRAFGPYLSSMILVCISLDRYTAIVHPLRVHDAQRRSRIMLGLAWLSSFVCSIPQCFIFHVESHPVQKSFQQCVSFNFFQAHYQEVIYNIFCISVVYLIPLILIIYCYSNIMWAIHKRSNTNNSEPNLPDRSLSTRLHLRISDVSRLEKSRARTLKMTIIIIITFFCCWTPYVVIDLWYLFDPNSAEAIDSRVQSSLFMFAVSNSCVNPLVYGSYMFDFTAFFRKLIPCTLYRVHREATVITRLTHIPVNDNNRLSPGNPHQEGEAIELREATPTKRYRARELPNISHSGLRTHSGPEYD